MPVFLRLLLFLCCVVTAWSRSLDLTVDAAVDQALRCNSGLQAARLRIEEARGRVDAAGRLPNPELSVSYNQNPRIPERTMGLQWLQRLPITDRRRLEKSVSHAELTAAQAEVRDAERRVAGEVRVVAIQLIALRAQRELRRKQLVNSKELAHFMTSRVAVGEAAAVDAAQVELEATQIATQMIALDVEVSALLGEMRPLLGLSGEQEFEITGDLEDFSPVPESSIVLQARPDYRAATAAAEAARQAAALARANQWQDLGITLRAEQDRREDAPAGFELERMLGVQFSLPLPLWNRNEGQVREATASAQRRAKEVEALSQQISGEAESRRRQMGAIARILADFDEKLLPQAQRIEERFRANYAAGLTSLPDVLRARGRRFDLEAMRLNWLRDYQTARARYLTVLGRTSDGAASGSGALPSKPR